MYNSKTPAADDLPSHKQLIKATIVAFVAAVFALITIILPAEFGVDPTGIGRVIGLTDMGEIKEQLHQEADEERRLQEEMGKTSFLDGVVNFLIPSAAAQEKPQEKVTLTLSPGQGAEIKLVMKKGAKATYRWRVVSGALNFDLHGEAKGQKIRYDKGRAVRGDEGELTAAFTGSHGWFWRNRTREDVTMILYVEGEYDRLKRIK